MVSFADPGITPNSDGLPGLAVVKTMVGALLTWDLVACVAGLVLAVLDHVSNPDDGFGSP